MARRLFRVPIALVTLVDGNRQWFKANCGLAAQETPRDISFCGHAILGDEILMIPDTLEDARFADNPLVTRTPHIRFYAGCPLSYARDIRLGTLCLIDDKPRSFDEDDANTLRDLAAMVEDELRSFQASTTDVLTGISNRRGFQILAQFSLNDCLYHQTSASLVFIDLDKFKQINDNYGHSAGDRALATFSGLLKSVFSHVDAIARLGGDEFVVLTTGKKLADTERDISRLQHQITAINATRSAPYELVFSYGIVEFDPQQPQSLDELIAAGDAVMYQLKKAKSER
ncbi:sensor domain-containing diguanylate cyclase [Serratia sp. NPDC078593]|uniref:sensor domain-containing diguanylate cyclase n=1 Tax=unclassified Serratia (in: enterobacteria) TaxID=2647522 RepID=UPI0037D43A07